MSDRRPPALLAPRARRLWLADAGAQPASTATSCPPTWRPCWPRPAIDGDRAGAGGVHTSRDRLPAQTSPRAPRSSPAWSAGSISRPPTRGDGSRTWRREPKLVGLRPMMQDLADDDWMLRPALAPAIEAMSAADLAFDALVKPRHLPILRRFAGRWPDAARSSSTTGPSPTSPAAAFEPWAGELRGPRPRDRRPCASSRASSPRPRRRFAAHDLWPYVDVLLDAFGPGRLMWGSDWPVREPRQQLQ